MQQTTTNPVTARLTGIMALVATFLNTIHLPCRSHYLVTSGAVAFYAECLPVVMTASGGFPLLHLRHSCRKPLARCAVNPAVTLPAPVHAEMSFVAENDGAGAGLPVGHLGCGMTRGALL